MKAKIFNIEGKKTKEIELPKIFSHPIREDIVAKILEIKKTKQPYAPSLVAGKQHSASGKVVRRRHVWKSGYGRGSSRVPKKIFTRRGSQFNWVGAEVASTRGGRRAHPPKTIAMINTSKINKKELKIAFASALSATANKKIVVSKYERLTEKDIETLPLIIESKITSLKTKELTSSLKKILGKGLFEIVSKKRKIRSGKGKLRGRKYKSPAGFLIVTGKNEILKTKLVETQKVDNLSVLDLAKGGLGRLILYTENAIKELGESK
ncbi:MAG TPA: 50S ribosomal protein L4 [Bacillota bacterium]|nr:50S ribosomal protein L4 [Bacillota bacterium]